MILGGIPYYLNCFNPSLSLAQNIDILFFNPKAKLGDEFERLFSSVFGNADGCMKIVRALGQRHAGYTKDEISSMTGINPNGDFSKMLKALVGSDFIIRYVPFGMGKHEEHYKLIDSFCWFWLHFKESKEVKEADYWQHHQKEPAMPEKTIHLTLVSIKGMEKNENSEIFTTSITADELFR